MSAIANQWTGDGLADGTVLTSANVNTAGNGATVSGAFTTGTATMVTEGHGFRIEATSTTAVRRLDCTVTGTSIRTQLKLTVKALPASASTYLQTFRDSSANMAILYMGTSGTIGLIANAGTFPSGAPTPAVAVNDTVLIDMVVAQSPSPTTTNGRIFYRVKNLTNPTWNTTGEFFFDTGYTVNVGMNAFAMVRFGKMQSETLPAPGLLYEFPGWEAITVNPAHTTEAQAKAYFADAPVTAVPLSTPVVTVTGSKDPTTVNGTDGEATVTWPAVSGATSYEAWRSTVNNPGQSDFVLVAEGVTSPYKFVGLGATQHALGIKAKA